MQEVKNNYAGSQILLCRKEGMSKGSPEQGLKTTYMTTVNSWVEIVQRKFHRFHCK